MVQKPLDQSESRILETTVSQTSGGMNLKILGSV